MLTISNRRLESQHRATVREEILARANVLQALLELVSLESNDQTDRMKSAAFSSMPDKADKMIELAGRASSLEPIAFLGILNRLSKEPRKKEEKK